jgi:predicted MPP superfamily phosphohydrolase
MAHNIRYLSDLHLEFIKPNKIKHFINKIPSGLDEICVLAGDIGNPYQSNYDIFIKFISKNFKKIFVISGNHEYYNKTKTVQETNEFMKDYFQQFDNISFLNNNYEIYDDYCFIGTTLWSKITNPEYEISDTTKIPHFDYIQYNRLNMLSVEFLEDALQNNHNCVVITHHVPSDFLIDIKYKTKMLLPYNQWFYCNMDKLIETYENKIKCWIYGHTHTPSNIIMNGIPFLCNPIGYPNENKNVNFKLTIEIRI